MPEKSKLDKLKEKEYNIPKEIEELANEIGGGWWNYRLIEKENRWTNEAGKEYFEKHFEMYEIYYRKDGEIWAWSENPTNVYFESLRDAKTLIKQIKKAIRKPVLRLVTGVDGKEELVPTMKTLKQYQETELSNWDFEDFWKEYQ